jgi:hypothetical protein
VAPTHALPQGLPHPTLVVFDGAPVLCVVRMDGEGRGGGRERRKGNKRIERKGNERASYRNAWNHAAMPRYKMHHTAMPCACCIDK